jgi:hypothetical protein
VANQIPNAIANQADELLLQDIRRPDTFVVDPELFTVDSLSSCLLYLKDDSNGSIRESFLLAACGLFESKRFLKLSSRIRLLIVGKNI